MRTKIKFFLTAFVFSLTFAFNANSQIAISNISEITKIKSGTTYIAMKDPNSEKVKEYINAFKSNWTIYKIEFIKYSDIEKFISPENSFLTIGGYETNTQFIKLYENGFSINAEITAKLALLNYRLVEVSVSYKPRTKLEGKKIKKRDAIRFAYCIVKYTILGRFNTWK